MKKILSAIVLGSLLAALLLPAVSLAQPEKPADTCYLERDLSDVDAACTLGASVSVDDYGMCCLVQIVYRVTNWLFYIMMILVVVMAVAGGFVYMTASGDPEKAGKGKTIIIFAIVGMAIALLAKAIPSIVKLVVGM